MMKMHSSLIGILALLLANPALMADEALDRHPLLLVTNAAADTISYVDPEVGLLERVEVGPAPFGIVTDQQGRAFITTARGVAIVDIRARALLDLIPYRSDTGKVQYGEYRAGGMGLDVSPDGRFVYVGVHLHGQNDRLEVIDTTLRRTIATFPIGARPFDLLLSRNGKRAYSIDHDSYSVTQIELESGATVTHKITPPGHGAFDKPHYAVLNTAGDLLLPVQGRTLVVLNPDDGSQQRHRLTAETHQHGVTINDDGDWLVVVGTGAAGGAQRGPSLTLYNLTSRSERIIPLMRTHEAVVLNRAGSHAYLSGGNSFTGGWNGITVVDLANGGSRTFEVPGQPLDLVAVERPSGEER